MSISIYHNPRCSKSRQTLKLLEEKGVQPEIVKYLDAPRIEPPWLGSWKCWSWNHAS